MRRFTIEGKTEWWPYVVTPIYVVLFFWLSSALGDSLVRNFPVIIVSYSILVYGALALRRVWDAIMVRRELIAFRSMSREQQELFLRGLWPKGLRQEYLNRIDADDSYEVAGSVARFPFPRSERSLHRRAAAILLLVACTLALVPLAFPMLPLPLRAVSIILAIGTAGPCAWVLGRLALLETVMEVSPFAVSLLGPRIGRRTVLLNQPLLLVNRPAKGYFELTAPVSGQRLRLHHARLGALHAYTLIRDFGQFKDVPPSADAAT